MIDLINLDVPALELRFVVECSHCGLQFASSERSPGDRLHCACGLVLEVPELDAHDEAVVFCSSCGTERAPGAEFCSECTQVLQTDRQLMHTICPDCATRIRDDARFCHSCAKSIDIARETLSVSPFQCVDCQPPVQLLERTIFPGWKPRGERVAGVTRRQERGVTFSECRQCVGLWFEKEPFRRLEEQAARAEKVAGEPPAPPAGAEQKPRRSCPRCNDELNRSTYDNSSGVEFDICARHGLWLDEGELAGIIHWIQSRPRGWQRMGERPARRQESRNRTPPDLGNMVDSELAIDVLFGALELLVEFLDD